MTKKMAIEGFAPTCLMGVTGAICEYKGYSDNVNRLYFHSSYVYEKKDENIYDSDENKMNVMFSRELPLKKEEFMERFSHYYGLDYFFKEVSKFDELLDIIEEHLNNNEPVMMEIDFFFMAKHRYYAIAHDQHMMIVEGIDREKKILQICEAIYGHFEMPFSEYRAYFDDVIQNRNRNVYLLLVKKNKKNSENIIRKEWFLHDLEKSYNNLSDNKNASLGMSALRDFKNDLLEIIKSGKCKNGIIIPGMWVFMCDNMNNVNFIQELKKDYPNFHSEVLEDLRKACVVINRKWFYISMALLHFGKYKYEDFEKTFITIEKTEIKKTELIRILMPEIRDI